jgi:hypothetical protein
MDVMRKEERLKTMVIGNNSCNCFRADLEQTLRLARTRSRRRRRRRSGAARFGRTLTSYNNKAKKLF